jgi:hypothetical protein
MVLNKYEENGSIECLYDSSNILGSKYITTDKKLAIIFGSGRQYVYEGVKYEDYKKFEGHPKVKVRLYIQYLKNIHTPNLKKM